MRGRPATYQPQHCPLCRTLLKRHKSVYYDCPQCEAHCLLKDGTIRVIEKRAHRVREWVGKYLDADGYEELVG